MEKETYWSRFASDFEEKNNLIVGKESMQVILKELAKEKNLGNCLELACGNGTYSKVLAKNASSLTCTDFSEQMVEASKERLKEFANIKVEQANCLDLPYADNTFDTVFMANLLHVLPTPEKAVAEAKRILKEGGQIIVIDLTVKGMRFSDKMKMGLRFLKTYGKPPKKAVPVDDIKLAELFTLNDVKIRFVKIIGERSKAVYGIGYKG